jgi:hypothetical protein
VTLGSELASEIRTLIDESTGEPRVVITVVRTADGQVVLPISFSPEEARDTARMLLEAAEAIEHDAHLMIVLRSRKLSEPAIHDLITAVREMRQADLNSLTIEESQEGVEED